MFVLLLSQRLFYFIHNVCNYPFPSIVSPSLPLFLVLLPLQLILPVSSWAFWGGMFSNATEIHVNAPPHHSVMYGQNQYIYHNEKTKEFFGSYSAKENDIIYRTNLTNHHHNKLRAKAVMKTHSTSTGTASANAYVEDKNKNNSSTHTVAPTSSHTGTSTVDTVQTSGKCCCFHCLRFCIF